MKDTCGKLLTERGVKCYQIPGKRYKGVVIYQVSRNKIY